MIIIIEATRVMRVRGGVRYKKNYRGKNTKISSLCSTILFYTGLNFLAAFMAKTFALSA